MTTDTDLRCDHCGGPVDGTDGYTDDLLVMCGSVYGNGCSDRIVHVAVYDVDRMYGGPEEGGWWYDTGQVVHRTTCRFYELDDVVKKLRETYPHTGKRSSVLGGEDYDIDWNETPPADYFPLERPGYE